MLSITLFREDRVQDFWNKKIAIGVLGGLVLLLTGCSSQHPAVNQSVWTYQPDAIVVNYAAAANLNSSEGQAHVLLLAVVQTTDLQNIQSYLQNPQGVSLLLEKSNDPNQVQNYYLTKVFINPGESRAIKVTRMAGMQHVVVLAGYNQLNPNQVLKIFNIPLRRKFFWGEHYPSIIQINLSLGEQGIIDANYVEK